MEVSYKEASNKRFWWFVKLGEEVSHSTFGSKRYHEKRFRKPCEGLWGVATTVFQLKKRILEEETTPPQHQ